MKPENRDTYLTRFRNKKIVEYLNDTAYREYFNDKSKFTARFSKYLKGILVISKNELRGIYKIHRKKSDNILQTL